MSKLIYTPAFKAAPLLYRMCFYVEPTQDMSLNAFIRDNYFELSAKFTACGLEFVYLPLLEKLTGDRAEFYLSGTTGHNIQSTPPYFQKILPEEVLTAVEKPSIVKFDRASHSFEISEIEVPFNQGLMVEVDSQPIFIMASCNHEDSDLMYCCEDEVEGLFFRDGDDDEEEETETETEMDTSVDDYNNLLIHEIESKFKQLECRGFSREALLRLFTPKVEPEGLLIINGDIILRRSYTKVQMTPMNRALYMLFLKHPEGIPISYLPDYEDELYQLYLPLSKRLDSRKLRTSVNKLCDPLGNDINIALSRIKRAFRAILDDSLAHHYYIDGPHGEAKSITLDRNKVEWR